MLKGVTIITVMCLSFALGLKKPNRMLIASVTVISVGVAMSSFGESSFSWLGMLMMGLSIVTEALRTVLAQVRRAARTARVVPFTEAFAV